jgi:DNA polymerase III alpha subunit (gram-positive type)
MTPSEREREGNDLLRHTHASFYQYGKYEIGNVCEKLGTRSAAAHEATLDFNVMSQNFASS